MLRPIGIVRKDIDCRCAGKITHDAVEGCLIVGLIAKHVGRKCQVVAAAHMKGDCMAVLDAVGHLGILAVRDFRESEIGTDSIGDIGKVFFALPVAV